MSGISLPITNCAVYVGYGGGAAVPFHKCAIINATSSGRSAGPEGAGFRVLPPICHSKSAGCFNRTLGRAGGDFKKPENIATLSLAKTPAENADDRPRHSVRTVQTYHVLCAVHKDSAPVLWNSAQTKDRHINVLILVGLFLATPVQLPRAVPWLVRGVTLWNCWLL